MISHALKVVYIHPPKTGGHTIDCFFRDHGLVSTAFWHDRADWIRETLGADTYEMYYSFATVRNPWDRWVSEWAWQRATDYSTQIPTPWGNKEISFDDFCKSSCDWYPVIEKKHGHLEDQSSFIFDANDNLMVRSLVRFEELQEGFNLITDWLGLPRSVLPHRNVSIHGDYRSYYTDKTAELIGKRFERDIRLLGYRFT